MSWGWWWLWSPLPSSQGISFQLIKQQPAATTTKSCATCDYDEDWLDSWVIIFRETPFKHLNSACRLAWSGGGRVQQIDGKLCNKLRTRTWHRTYWLLLLLFRLNCILNNPPPFHTFWAVKLFELSPPTTQCPYNPLGHEIFLFINVTFEHQTTDQQSSCPPFIRGSPGINCNTLTTMFWFLSWHTDGARNGYSLGVGGMVTNEGLWAFVMHEDWVGGERRTLFVGDG